MSQTPPSAYPGPMPPQPAKLLKVAPTTSRQPTSWFFPNRAIQVCITAPRAPKVCGFPGRPLARPNPTLTQQIVTSLPRDSGAVSNVTICHTITYESLSSKGRHKCDRSLHDSRGDM